MSEASTNFNFNKNLELAALKQFREKSDCMV